ncbi:hypothetical protein AAHA92_17665 [Salvia divinorum]|uniref:Secreted protein n=1 Tax=Salvia divinorum TaxID=28513 RepID=A0ABD1GZI9_SALDI
MWRCLAVLGRRLPFLAVGLVTLVLLVFLLFERWCSLSWRRRRRRCSEVPIARNRSRLLGRRFAAPKLLVVYAAAEFSAVPLTSP